uniref:V-type ATP synthase subunit I n=1 Tax=candidate division WOR-3 bacterium TaxID=2052148 RepID=A0A7V3KNR3_UNCW3
MAKVPLKKIVFYVHYSERDKLLERLQDEGLVHFTEIRKDLKEEFGVTHLSEDEFESHLEAVITRLSNAIKFLESFAKKKSLIESLYEAKKAFEKKEFFKIANCVEPGTILVQVETLEQELAQLAQEESNLIAQRNFILPWVNLNYNLEEIKSTNELIMLPGSIPSNKLSSLEDYPLAYQLVSDDGKRAYVVIVYHTKDEDSVRPILQEKEFELIEFHGYTGRPADILEEIDNRIKVLEEEKKNLKQAIEKVSAHYDSLLVLHDYYLAIYNRELTDNRGLKTACISVYQGFVRERDLSKLDKIFSEFETAYYEVVNLEDGEELPVELENSKIFKPFEGLVRMYGLPSYIEPDPTALITPFFVLFFGICYGDAAYGLLLAIFSIWLMMKLKISAPLLWILFSGGIVSMIFGALTGGWFGDFFERANIGLLNAFRKKMMLFDPMTDVMTFFALTIALGFIQINVGLAVNAYKRIKEGDTLGALSQPIAWIVILLSLAYMGLFAGKVSNPLLNNAVKGVALLFVLFMVLFSSRHSRNFIIRIIKGAYNVYNGVGFIGDLLSYVRLMALGLTSSGIAMAINILTLLVWQIPIAGYILGPIVFVFGHLFSFAINILGSIVHPLRLQYVEFFKQFYDDGGTPFLPLKWEGKYTEIVEIKKQEV